MINVNEFYGELFKNGIDFFCGVPDSLLKSFCACVSANTPAERNIVTSNEGAAIALAAGYHIGTGKIPLVYMQNSGLGNAVNPLLSLTDPEVYSIPVLLMIGWRGEPGIKDEPQHVKQGKVTPALLSAMGIPCSVIDAGSDIQDFLATAISHCRNQSFPYAILVKKDTFSEFSPEISVVTDYCMSREKALEIILEIIPSGSVIISATGMLSRELFELRERREEPHHTDFLTVGSMGHTSQIALGVALSVTNRPVYCFDGDGGALMHLGSYGVAGNLKPGNLRFILFNNGAHDSVGGQPTVGLQTDFQSIFRGFGFQFVGIAKESNELKEKVSKLISAPGPSLLEIRIRKGARKDLGRPTQTPLSGKQDLMNFLSQ
jgi:phosphonopyruvate decarboxylase